MSNNTILGIPFNLINYSDVFNLIRSWRDKGEKHYICITNPHSVMLSRRDIDMRKAIGEAKLVLPDGIGIILASFLLGYKHKGRITGPTLMMKLCELGREYQYRHFFYGGGKNVVEDLVRKLSLMFPGLQISGLYSPPFRDLSEEEDNKVIEKINSTKPDIVWVGLGAPRQEKWMRDHLNKIDCTAMIGVGAAFDFHSGNVRWAPSWIRNIGLEWLWRLILDPQKMWRRNIDSPLFLIKVFKQWLYMTFGSK